MNPNMWIGGYFSLPIDTYSLLLALDTASELKVFLYLHAQVWRAHNFADEDCEVSRQQIATATGLSVTSVKTAIQLLQNKGYLLISRNNGGPSKYETAIPHVKTRKPRSLNVPSQDEPGQPAARPEAEPGQPAARPDSITLIDKPSLDKSPPQDFSNPSSDAPRREDDDSPPITARPIFEPNVVKGVKRFIEEAGGNPVSAMRGRVTPHLRKQESIARTLDSDGHREWRERLGESIGAYLADPSIGDLSQAILKVWATQKRTYEPRSALSAEKEKQPRRVFEIFLREIAEQEGLELPTDRIPSWKLDILEAWKVEDEAGFTEDFQEMCADGAEGKYSFGAVVELAVADAKNPHKQLIRRVRRG